MSEATKPFRILPQVTDENEHFWLGGADGELRLWRGVEDDYPDSFPLGDTLTALAAAADFRRHRMDLQVEQTSRLAEVLPLPQLHLRTCARMSSRRVGTSGFSVRLTSSGATDATLRCEERLSSDEICFLQNVSLADIARGRVRVM